jgi:ABC-2 type transport system permease protein
MAASMMTSGQFLGVLFAMFLGVLLMTNEFAPLSTAMTGWIVIRSVLLNLLAFVIWAIFGLGLGTLIRSQVTAVVAGVAVYLGGFAAVELIFHGIYYSYRQGWVLGGPVIAPAVASNVMITPGRAFPHAPQWTGLVIIVGYALLLAAAGIALTRHRDMTF